jgi:hypothetical protein
VSSFHTDYKAAHTEACTQARKLNLDMQLAAGKEYTRKGYYVRIALKAQNRFGRDAEGEFITPNTPLMS